MESVAIVGMVGRFPGARGIEEFWGNLRDGIESISFFTDEELVAAGVERHVLSNPDYVRANGVLEDAELFDAAFFGFSPREAEVTDPQHRVFLECAWEALENAGYDPARYKGRIAVYAGAGLSTYLLNNLLRSPEAVRHAGDVQLLMGNHKDYVATRVSYKLDLRGPSVNVGTACSTSLVAVHMACQSLLDYHCDMALAGGVSIQVPQKHGYLFDANGISSPDGHCRAFDAGAQGTVSGSGVGIVVLKRLEDALADGDGIRAIILGSAINNDGSEKVGYTAPSVHGQSEVIAEAQAVAAIDPDTIAYLEAHGTGTRVGDPIEVQALTEVFRRRTSRVGFCAIGSVKTNVGHLDEAAGVAGLIKTVLAMEHHIIPPSLHFRKANPEIGFASSPFFVNTAPREWKADGIPRRAGVSSFGIGGTNAHLVVQEAPAVGTGSSGSPVQLLTVSGKTAGALETATANLTEFLRHRPETNLADAAYTLHVGRKAFEHRRAIVRGGGPDRVFTGRARESVSVAFVFSGQGTQYPGMGMDLYRSQPKFRESVDRCCDILDAHLGCDLRTVLGADAIHQTIYTQPALFVLEYALAHLLMSWGVRPDAMIGHSIGEYVAACLSGVVPLESALALVAARGKLMQELPGGSMLAAHLPEEELRDLLGKRVAIAAVNGPALCVVSGPPEDIDAVERKLKAIGAGVDRLKTSHAFHSQMMDPILAPFSREVRKVKLSAPQIPYVSNVTGDWISAGQATDPSYWAAHLRGTVRFSEGMKTLAKDADRVAIDIGPGRATPAALLTRLGQLWVNGGSIDWTAYHAGEARRRLALPTYPFDRQRYWIEPPRARVDAKPASRRAIEDWFYAPVWKRSAASPAPWSPARFLVLADSASEGGIGPSLSAALRARGHDVRVAYWRPEPR